VTPATSLNSEKRRWLRIHNLSTDKQHVGLLPVSEATIWRWVKQGKFPMPFKLGANVTVWDAKEVDSWLKQQAEQRSA
jgi:prophage regulatory protein